jgi:hypothetical protein
MRVHGPTWSLSRSPMGWMETRRAQPGRAVLDAPARSDPLGRHGPGRRGLCCPRRPPRRGARSEAGPGTGEGPRPAASKPRGGITRCAPSGALPLDGPRPLRRPPGAIDRASRRRRAGGAMPPGDSGRPLRRWRRAAGPPRGSCRGRPARPGAGGTLPAPRCGRPSRSMRPGPRGARSPPDAGPGRRSGYRPGPGTAIRTWARAARRPGKRRPRLARWRPGPAAAPRGSRHRGARAVRQCAGRRRTGRRRAGRGWADSSPARAAAICASRLGERHTRPARYTPGPRICSCWPLAARPPDQWSASTSIGSVSSSATGSLPSSDSSKAGSVSVTALRSLASRSR